MIKCSNLVKKFRSGSEFYAVNDINIEIKKGEFVARIFSVMKNI